jgi:hypothetical protein
LDTTLTSNPQVYKALEDMLVDFAVFYDEE